MLNQLTLNALSFAMWPACAFQRVAQTATIKSTLHTMIGFLAKYSSPTANIRSAVRCPTDEGIDNHERHVFACFASACSRATETCSWLIPSARGSLGPYLYQRCLRRHCNSADQVSKMSESCGRMLRPHQNSSRGWLAMHISCARAIWSGQATVYA